MENEKRDGGRTSSLDLYRFLKGLLERRAFFTLGLTPFNGPRACRRSRDARRSYTMLTLRLRAAGLMTHSQKSKGLACNDIRHMKIFVATKKCVFL
jgi:hypothetical protein